MNWDEYTELMAANGQKVYAIQVGHHGVYERIKRTTSTIYPHRLDTHEMRLDWVMKREVYPLLAIASQYGYRRRVIWIKDHSPLFQTMISDITRRLVAEGREVSEQEDFGRGHRLEISWSAPISA